MKRFDEQLSFGGYGVSLAEKTERAIALLKQYEPEAIERDPLGYYLAFSGGKDSVVIADLAKRAGVRHRKVYHVTGIDPPELVQFIHHQHKDCVLTRSDKPFFVRLAEDKGLPTRMIRWCCEYYKHKFGGDSLRIIGVRSLESPARKLRYKTERVDDGLGASVYPILWWSDEDVWQYIHENSVACCSLYDEGFKRLGCIGCPMSGANRRLEFARWPKYEALWRKFSAMYWDKYKGVPTLKGNARYLERFKSHDELFAWWLSDHPTPDDGTCQQGLW